MSDYWSALVELLHGHPAGLAGAILILALAARIIGRFALYALVLVVLILAAGFFSEDFFGGILQ